MPDYKEMYLKLFRAAEEAINVLIAARRDCEEMYIRDQEPPIIHIVPPNEPDKDQPDKGQGAAPPPEEE